MQIVNPYYMVFSTFGSMFTKNYVVAGNTTLPFMEIFSNMFKHGMAVN